MRQLIPNLQLISKFSVTRYPLAKEIPSTVQRHHMNLFEAVNSAIDIALEKDQT